ncbi:MAG UNVERIFIED_CONTAM: NUDIX hydrolase [Rickettsiaceae bacterium]|jgi:8-oxo-dGTP diphosphatase
MNQRPKVGIGVLIFNDNGQMLLGKRITEVGINTYSPPGGHLEYGESFEECAIRETQEEAGITIENPTFVAITNDIHESENKHYISIFMQARYQGAQKIQNMEPHKTLEWNWYSLEQLPDNLFLPLEQLLENKAYGKKLIEEIIV